MKKVSRRGCLRRMAIAGGAVGFPTIIPSTVLGQDGNVAPSELVAIGVIGCGNRGRYAGAYQNDLTRKKSKIVAVSDPMKWRRLHFKKLFGNCDDYIDFRELLARKDVDAVHIATADHWHVPIAMLAAKAGKDMYTEKPLGICIDQDLKSRAIVDKYKRVFQYGAQQRSIAHVRLGIELVLNGHIGEVKEVYVWAPEGVSGGSATPVLPVPDGINYDMWLGPAPEAPFCADRVLYQPGKWWTNSNGIFHIHDYAIGFIAGWGAHPMDMLQWWADNAGMKEIPVKYEGAGTLPTKGLFNTVLHWDVKSIYANGIKMRFMDAKTAGKKKPHPGVEGGHGTLFVGSKGWVMVSRGRWKTSSLELRRKVKNPGEKRLKVSRDQIDNFVDCVRSREMPVDDLHAAVRSDVATHLAEICVRTGRPITWDPEKETIVGDAEAAKMMKRPMRKPWTL